MQVSYKWLSKYIDLTNITPDELADKMSRTGIEIEEVVKLDEGLKKIVVGEVLECVPHPNSDHLHVCQVNIGKEVTQIVCGAPNVASGQKVIVALPGARIVDNVKIKKGKIRGEVSNGMLCSLEELGISTNVIPKYESDGIYILDDSAVPGENALPLVEMDDTVLDLAITPNRADALSMRGVCYEVAAIYQKDFEFPKYELETIKGNNPIEVEVLTEKAETYSARYIKNVQITESPKWMQFELMHAGIRPINNVVDITNYVLLMTGQPLHAYDADKLNGKLEVRFAKENEKIAALNEEEYELINEDLVIADNNGPVALAGVIGGEKTSVSDSTTNVCLEAALFDQTTIRKTSQRHHVRTDASQRFEKGIDKGFTNQALDMAAALLSKYAKGEVVEEIVNPKQAKVENKTVTIEVKQIEKALGDKIGYKTIVDILNALKFDFDEVADEVLTIKIPSRRFDISIQADIVEEIGRLYGYDNLPNVLPTLPLTPGKRSEMQKLIKTTRMSLQKLGLQETINYALTTESKAKAFELEDNKTIKLQWPMSEERSVLRRNLVSGLLDSVSYNLARKNSNLAFYEIGKIFSDNDKFTEENHVAFVVTGAFKESNWNAKEVEADFYIAKGIVENYLNDFDFEEQITYQANVEKENMHPYQTADIYLGTEKIGFVGQVHPTTAKELNLNKTFVAEIDLEKVLKATKKDLVAEEISKYPAVTRDISLLVNESLEHQTIVETIKEKGSKALTNVKLFDLYAGSNLEKGYKSMAYQLTFQKQDSTLTDEEIENIMAKLTKNLEEKLGAEIR